MERSIISRFRVPHENVRIVHFDLGGNPPRDPVLDALHAAVLFKAKQLSNLQRAAQFLDKFLVIGHSRHVYIKHHV
jgi:hypothetical protein